MATQIQWRKGTTAQHTTFTGAIGEVTVDTDKDVVVVHDGTTAGGHPAAKESDLTAHLNDAVDAHDASAISNVPAGNIVATTVQAAIDELDSEKIATSAIGATVQAYDALLAGIAADTTHLGGFRNKIIGGDFTTNPWQRGTSFTAPASAAYAADRWLSSHSSDAVVDILKTADAPTAAQAGVYTVHCLHADVTTADASIAVGQYYNIMQKLEGLNVACFGFGQAGTRYVTLSFWHKHTKTGTYCVAIRNSATNRSYIAEYTQDVTDTWERAELTIPVDTSGTWLYDTGIGMFLTFAMAVGSSLHAPAAGAWQAGNYMATANQVNALDNTANNFKIALVQLEAGSVATPFETRSVGQELALCERYYEKSFQQGVAPAQGLNDFLGSFYFMATTASQYNYLQFRTRKRATPTTFATYNPSTNANANVRDATANADRTVATGTKSETGVYAFGATGCTATNSHFVHWTADAEL